MLGRVQRYGERLQRSRPRPTRTPRSSHRPFAVTPTKEGRLLGHVHLGLRLIEEQASGPEPDALAELLRAHHVSRSARTTEAAVLYHANQLDTLEATRPGGE